MQNTISSSGSIALIFMAALAIIVEPASTTAQVTASQRVNADWSWRQMPNNTLLSDSGSRTSDSTGTLNYSPNAIGLNSVEANLNLSVDLDQGSVKSNTTFDVNGSNAGESGFVSLDLTSFNRVNIEDTISLDPGILGSVRIRVKQTGAMIQNGNLIGRGSGAFVSNMETFGSFSTLASAREETKSSVDTLSGSSGGFNPSNINEFHIVNQDYTLVVNEDLKFNEFDFSFAYEEEMSFSINGLDITGFILEQENDFSRTIELFANVYDENGILIEGATVNSSSGLTYRNFSAVPEPSSATLMLPLLGAICLLRRRRE